jgi:hypothetical protein
MRGAFFVEPDTAAASPAKCAVEPTSLLSNRLDDRVRHPAFLLNQSRGRFLQPLEDDNHSYNATQNETKRAEHEIDEKPVRTGKREHGDGRIVER